MSIITKRVIYNAKNKNYVLELQPDVEVAKIVNVNGMEYVEFVYRDGYKIVKTDRIEKYLVGISYNTNNNVLKYYLYGGKTLIGKYDTNINDSIESKSDLLVVSNGDGIIELIQGNQSYELRVDLWWVDPKIVAYKTDIETSDRVEVKHSLQGELQSLMGHLIKNKGGDTLSSIALCNGLQKIIEDSNQIKEIAETKKIIEAIKNIVRRMLSGCADYEKIECRLIEAPCNIETLNLDNYTGSVITDDINYNVHVINEGGNKCENVKVYIRDTKSDKVRQFIIDNDTISIYTAFNLNSIKSFDLLCKMLLVKELNLAHYKVV